MSPAALSFLHNFVNTCLKANVPVSLCGEIAGEPLEAMALMGLGFRHLSMAPTSIGPVKSMVRSLSASDLEQHLESLTDFSGLSMCRILRTFAMDNSVMI
jgi:phosphotransferase system enzyme I (PtsP)